MRHILLFLLLASTYVSLFSQEVEIENPLAFYADVMINASSPEHRSYASVKFQNMLENRIALDGSFADEMADLPWIFVRYSDDKSFKLISWQVEIKEDVYQYWSYFQKNGEKPIKLTNSSTEIDRRSQYDADNFYGAIMHEIESYDGYYLVSAYRRLANQSIQKIVDVLTIENGVPRFGKSIFYEDEKVPEGRGHKRIIMNYSSVATANLNINLTGEEKTIVYDHIIEVPGKTAGEQMIQVPDGSYEAYILNDSGRWIYKANLYDGLENNPPNGAGVRRRN